MGSHAPPHTYSPDFADLFRALTNLLSSPGGNLLWDLFLQALGIIITVVVIQRYIERREERRWLPARQLLYSSLFQSADYLVHLLPWERQGDLERATYSFGTYGYGTLDFGGSFIDSLADIPLPEYESRVKALAERPRLMESFQNSFDSALGPTADVFLAREPDLNALIGLVRERLRDFNVTLEAYQQASLNLSVSELEGDSPAYYREDLEYHVSFAMKQACITLSRLVLAGFQLWLWLAAHADDKGR